MTRAILWLSLALTCNVLPVPDGEELRLGPIQTLDNCATDTECQEAANRHCESDEAEYCDEAEEAAHSDAPEVLLAR